MPIELVNLMAQFGMGALFFWMYWDERKRNQAKDDRRDQDIATLYRMWLNDMRGLAKLPTDLDADYKLGPDSRVKA